MATLDIFQQDAFSAIELTDAIEQVDYQPMALGALGIFEPAPIRTTTAMVEERDQVLALIQTSPRGAPPVQRETEQRTARAFPTWRIAKSDRIMADELQSIRAFGSESELAQVQQEVARRMAALRADTELTLENMRLGAIQGIVTDADGSVKVNWFDAFGITQPAEIDFELDDAATDVRLKCATVYRAMAKAAKGAFTPNTRIHAVAGDEFYDKLISHAKVVATYQNWSAAAELRADRSYESFPFGKITFHNYRGTDDGSTVAVPSNKAKFFPVGARGVFKHVMSPAERMEFVNTPGREIYAFTVPDRDRDMWVDVESYSYPLFMCTRPAVLQRAKMQ